MALVTEQWSARTYSPGKSATQEFRVSGVTTLLEAIDEVFNQRGVKQGDPFVLDNTIKAQTPTSSTPDGPSSFIVNYAFAGPAGGGGSTFINNPPEYFPQFQPTSFPVDRDYQGNPIVVSTREAPSTPPNIEDVDVQYTYKRYEASFDGARALAYRRSVNSDAFTLPGFGVLQPGQARLRYIAVEGGFTRDATAVKVVYAFALREEGWDIRMLDQGPRAFYTPPGTPLGEPVLGEIFDARGNAIGKDVKLNGFGIPIDPSFDVGSPGLPPQAATSSPTGATVELIGTGNLKSVFLKYKGYKPMPYSGLTLTA